MTTTLTIFKNPGTPQCSVRSTGPKSVTLAREPLQLRWTGSSIPSWGTFPSRSVVAGVSEGCSGPHPSLGWHGQRSFVVFGGWRSHLPTSTKRIERMRGGLTKL